jgi:hypothetical protein
MGNRAVVVFTTDKGEISPAVYLHWQGGPESIYQFLAELDRRNVRADACYETARFIQIVGEYVDHQQRSGLSLGVYPPPTSINAVGLPRGWMEDNGVYVVNRQQKRVRRFGMRNGEKVEFPEEAVAREFEEQKKSDYYKDGGFRPAWGDTPIEGGRMDKIGIDHFISKAQKKVLNYGIHGDESGYFWTSSGT